MYQDNDVVDAPTDHLAERWFFFAEGNHPQNIYYQSIA